MPLPKLCSENGCKTISRDGSHKCIAHRKVRRRNEVVERSAFYLTPRWKRFSKSLRQRRPICECCNKEIATDVDHWIERSIDPSELYWFDERNMVCLCKSCHYRKGNKLRRWIQDNDHKQIYQYLWNWHPRPSERDYLNDWIQEAVKERSQG